MSELLFHRVEPGDKEKYDKYAFSMYMYTCDCSFANIIIWSEIYNTEIAFSEYAAIVRYCIDGKYYYAYPVAADENKRISSVRELLETGEDISFIGISETAKEEIQNNFPSTFEIDENRDIFDYVYEREKLATLSGKHYAAKRNHIHRFEDYGQWQYEDLDKSNLKECWELELNWINNQLDRQNTADGKTPLIEESRDNSVSILAEKNALKCAIDNFEELSLFGGAIRQNGRIVAFCIAERLNSDTCVVHFEKAYSEIQGAFQIINRQFAVYHPEYEYINREDDIGDAGLRKAKLSYRPHNLVKKYSAVKSSFTYAVKEDLEEVTDIWMRCFGDSKEYVTVFFDALFRENNVMLYRKAGKIVSMTCLFDCTIKESDCNKNAHYVYALCTSPEYRDLGYASDLIRHIKEKYSSPLVLCLGSPELEAFYEKNGFKSYSNAVEIKDNILRTDFRSEMTLNDTPSLSPEDLVEITTVTDEFVDNYIKIRNDCLAGDNSYSSFVEWNKDYIKFACNDHIRAGGIIVKYHNGYIMFFVEAGVIRIVENILPKEKNRELLCLLAEKYDAEEFRVSLEKSMIYDKNVCETDAGGLTATEKGYLALTLG